MAAAVTAEQTNNGPSATEGGADGERQPGPALSTKSHTRVEHLGMEGSLKITEPRNGLEGCMGTVESRPEPLIDHLRRTLSQLQGHR